jgi:hypothetical protein
LRGGRRRGRGLASVAQWHPAVERAVRSRLLVVNLKSEAQQVTEVLGILERLEIAADVQTAPTAAPAPAAVVLRISPDRLVEAVLALNYHGFADVRAYEGERS